MGYGSAEKKAVLPDHLQLLEIICDVLTTISIRRKIHFTYV